MKASEVLPQIERHFNILPLGEKSAGLGKVLSSETGSRVLELLSGSNLRVGLSATEISKSLGVGRTTVLYHLERIKESGLVEVNRHLADEKVWKTFWEDYRKGGTDYTKEEFNRLHEARLKGEKLFVPTRKGVLFLPSSDESSVHAMIADALSYLATPAAEKGYRKALRGSAAMGVLGLMLLAFSFSFHPGPLDLLASPQPVMQGGEPFLAEHATPESEMEPAVAPLAARGAPEEEEVPDEGPLPPPAEIEQEGQGSGKLPLALSYIGIFLLGGGMGTFAYAHFIRGPPNV